MEEDLKAMNKTIGVLTGTLGILAATAFAQVPASIRKPVIVGQELLVEQTGTCPFDVGQRVLCVKGDSPICGKFSLIGPVIPDLSDSRARRQCHCCHDT
jgi:hypothetical protein